MTMRAGNEKAVLIEDINGNPILSVNPDGTFSDSPALPANPNATYPSVSPTAPNPAVMPVYIDTSVSPALLKQWNGSAWVPMASQNDALIYALVMGGD